MRRWLLLITAVVGALSLGCGKEPSPGAVANATQDDFRYMVVDSERPVLVEFWSESCKPCKLLEPHLISLARDHHELLVVRVNSDENQNLAEDLGVRMLPTLLIFQDGEEKRRKIGFDKPEELADLVSAYITSQ